MRARVTHGRSNAEFAVDENPRLTDILLEATGRHDVILDQVVISVIGPEAVVMQVAWHFGKNESSSFGTIVVGKAGMLPDAT